jgi:hypothetical protein
MKMSASKWRKTLNRRALYRHGPRTTSLYFNVWIVLPMAVASTWVNFDLWKNLCLVSNPSLWIRYVLKYQILALNIISRNFRSLSVLGLWVPCSTVPSAFEVAWYLQTEHCSNLITTNLRLMFIFLGHARYTVLHNSNKSNTCPKTT